MEIACTIITYSRQCELSKKHAYSFHGSMYVLRSVKYLSQSVTFYHTGIESSVSSSPVLCSSSTMFENRSGSKLLTRVYLVRNLLRYCLFVLPESSLATAAQSSPCFLTAYFSSASSSGDHLPAFFALAGSM